MAPEESTLLEMSTDMQDFQKGCIEGSTRCLRFLYALIVEDGSWSAGKGMRVAGNALRGPMPSNTTWEQQGVIRTLTFMWLAGSSLVVVTLLRNYTMEHAGDVEVC